MGAGSQPPGKKPGKQPQETEERGLRQAQAPVVWIDWVREIHAPLYGPHSTCLEFCRTLLYAPWQQYAACALAERTLAASPEKIPGRCSPQEKRPMHRVWLSTPVLAICALAVNFMRMESSRVATGSSAVTTQASEK